jgi:CMP-N-acetylneuraminic acid synthetase|tara:strand:+ start:497 stop:1222 length:726 start_codon:yes stop_codon:yes gene_type:complete
MIISILIGRKGSRGFKGKNTKKILGKACCEYPLIAAKNSKFVKKIFVSTDCPKIKNISKNYGAEIIERPKKLANSNALGEDVYKHAYEEVEKKYGKKKISLIVLLMANAPTINSKMIDTGIKKLQKNKKFDSVVSTSVYNMWSPLRARKLSKDGTLKPFVPFKNFGDPKTLNCDRDSQGSVFFADMSVSIVRPHCLTNMDKGLLPQKWMGQKIAPLFSWAGCDIDYEWQIPQVEFWLKNNK